MLKPNYSTFSSQLSPIKGEKRSRPVPSGFEKYFNHGWDALIKDGDRWITLPKKIYLTPSAIIERWANPDVIIGLGFGKETYYGLIDIDADSPYNCEEGLKLIQYALEDIGITKIISIQSSSSGGWHIYFFLPEVVPTFKLATAIAVVIKEQGLTIDKGILEIFPNTKSYDKNGFIKYNGHRLPLQPGTGSYILDDDLQPYSNSLDTFLSQANQCALSVDFDVLEEVLELGPERWKELNKVTSFAGFLSKKRSKTAKEWEKSDRATITEGWTDNHQSNDLLGVIAEYGRVFKGIDDESELAAYIVKTAIAAPGYFEYCRHQNEIESWARRWAKCAMLHRFPYGSRKGEFKPLGKGGPTNEEKKADAYRRIIEVVEDLTITGRLPETIRDRRKLIARCAQCSERTLAKIEYLPLWHPKHQKAYTASNTEDGKCCDHTPLLTVYGSDVAEKEFFNFSNSVVAITDQTQSEKNPQEIISTESQESNKILPFSQIPQSVLPAAAQKVVKIHETIDIKGFECLQHTQDDSQSVLLDESKQSPKVYQHNPQRFKLWSDELGRIFHVGDRVIEIVRPREVLIIVEIKNDGWMRCQDDWGISLYHASKLIPDEF